MRVPIHVLALALAAASATAFVGCGTDDGRNGSAVHDVAAGDVAIVGSTPIAKARFDRALQARTRGVSPLTGGAASAQTPLDAPDFRRCTRALRTSLAASAKALPAGQRPAAPTKAQLHANCAAQYAQARTATMSTLLQEQWLVEQAAAKKTSVAGKEIDAVYAQYEAAAGLRADGKPLPPAAARRAFATRLRQSGLTEQDVRAQLRAIVLQQRLAATQREQRAPTTDELKRFLVAHPALFGAAGTRTIDLVTTRSKAAAERARAALAKGEDVQAVVRANATGGIAQTAQQGRVTVTEGAGQLSPEVEAAVFRTAKGKTGAVVPSGDTFVAFAVRKVRDTKVPRFAKVRAQVAQQYVAQQAQRAQIAFQNELQRAWRPKTTCRKGYIVPQCANGPELPEQPAPGAAGKD